MGFYPEQPDRGRGQGHWCFLYLHERCIFFLYQFVWLLVHICTYKCTCIVCMCASWEYVLSLSMAGPEDTELQESHLYQPTGFSST